MKGSPSLESAPLIANWLSFQKLGRIQISSGKVEIGQRINTALAQLVATEFGLSSEVIDVLDVDTGRSPDEGYTSGSNSIQHSGEALRSACVGALGLLQQIATAKLDANESDLHYANGVFHVAGTNRSATIWDLAHEADFHVAVDPSRPRTLVSAETTVATTHIESRSIRPLVTGEYQFVHDMCVPEMLHARVVRPPNYHARLASDPDSVFDACTDPSVHLTVDGSFVAVVAENEWQVIKAAEKLSRKLQWETGPGLDEQDVFTQLRSNPRDSLLVQDGTPTRQPVPSEPLRDCPGGQVLRARYERPYQMHASLGPSAALAQFDGQQLTIHSHTQGVFPLRGSIAQALGMETAGCSHRARPGSRLLRTQWRG